MEFGSTLADAAPVPGRIPDVPRPVPPLVPEAAIVDPAEHNVVFLGLVTGDKDIVGLVAYSIYKQNKYDWLMAFNEQTGRAPDPAEVQSYLCGESTPRRLATYRHLAEATLTGRGLEVPGARHGAVPPRTVFSEPPGPRDSVRPLLIGLVILLLVAAGLWWFFHGGPAPGPR